MRTVRVILGRPPPPANRTARRGRGARLPTISQREPFGETLAVDIARIAIVEQVAQLMNENVVEIEALDRFFAPEQLPRGRPFLDPAAAVHAGLDQLFGQEWLSLDSFF